MDRVRDSLWLAEADEDFEEFQFRMDTATDRYSFLLSMSLDMGEESGVEGLLPDRICCPVQVRLPEPSKYQVQLAEAEARAALKKAEKEKLAAEAKSRAREERLVRRSKRVRKIKRLSFVEVEIEPVQLSRTERLGDVTFESIQASFRATKEAVLRVRRNAGSNG